MTLPGKDISPMQWIMWAAGVLLLFVLAGVNEKLNAMQEEHANLLKVSIIQCVNHAENVEDGENRRRQQRRCWTLELNPR